MKKNILIALLLASTSLFAHDHEDGAKESHGNRPDEKKCFKEIRALGCGNPDYTATFTACVDSKITKLSGVCQDFHKDEVKRMNGED